VNGKSKEKVQMDTEQIQALRERIQNGRLAEKDSALMVKMLDYLLRLLRFIDEKKMSIQRLKNLIFGQSRSSKKKTLTHLDRPNPVVNPATENPKKATVVNPTPATRLRTRYNANTNIVPVSAARSADAARCLNSNPFLKSNLTAMRH